MRNSKSPTVQSRLETLTDNKLAHDQSTANTDSTVIYDTGGIQQ